MGSGCSTALILVLLAGPAHSALPTELEDCTGSQADFCFDAAPILLDESCGSRFDCYQGRIAWPALRNVGPVTIAVQTRSIPLGYTAFPLYVEVVARDNPLDPGDCQTGTS